jgi:hypothetical protein
MRQLALNGATLIAVFLSVAAAASGQEGAMAEHTTQDISKCVFDAPLACGQTKSGLLQAPPNLPIDCTHYGIVNGEAFVSQFDTYDFHGVAGQDVAATVGMTEPILFLLRKSDYTVIGSASNHGTAASVIATLPETTDYVVAVATFSPADDRYTLSFQCDAAIPRPNLLAYKPASWSDKLVVSNVKGTHADTAIVVGDGRAATVTAYVDWAVMNDGAAPASPSHYVSLYLDGTVVGRWQNSADLPAGYYETVEDYPVGLTEGQHTFTLVADDSGAITESNETDNSYTRSINVGGPPPKPAARGTVTLVDTPSRHPRVVPRGGE